MAEPEATMSYSRIHMRLLGTVKGAMRYAELLVGMLYRRLRQEIKNRISFVM